MTPDYGRPTGEDCLNLNVWTPPDGASRSHQKPVMVWIHGGGFLNGSADIYDARWMATQGDIVVVTVNYRLGDPRVPGGSRVEPGRRCRQLRSGRSTGLAAVGS